MTEWLSTAQKPEKYCNKLTKDFKNGPHQKKKKKKGTLKPKPEMLLELSSEVVLNGMREKENSSFADLCWYSPILLNIFGTKCHVTISKQIKATLKEGEVLLIAGEVSHTVNLWEHH